MQSLSCASSVHRARPGASLGSGRAATFACALLSISFAACATDDSFADQATLVEGIYEVESHRLNEGACAPGGEDLDDLHRFAYAKRFELAGIEILSVYSCESLTACRALAASALPSGPIEFEFTVSSVDGGALLGNGSSTGFFDGGVCRAPEAWNTTLELDGETLRIERAIRVGPDYVATNDFCTSDAGERAAEGVACSKFETLTAILREAL